MKKSRLKTLWELFYTFLKAGTFTFAGGLAMLPLIEKDVVDKYGLLDRNSFLEYATLSQTLPGVIAINCAAFVGRSAAGTAGMLVAGFGAALPAFIPMVIATMLIQLIPREGPVVGAFRGIRAASAALVLSAAFTLGRHNLKSAFSIVVMIVSFILIVFFNASVILVVLIAGCAGYAYRYMNRRKGGEKQ
jgi:chromate transporter